uniref:Uncharacterized protein n=1 Tax=uncultured Desulfobacterium sp. TaxID=201089 RepID=E1YII0_9BACT|nr:unknown protein [uncultured Desulfobacterium sp.]
MKEQGTRDKGQGTRFKEKVAHKLVREKMKSICILVQVLKSVLLDLEST